LEELLRLKKFEQPEDEFWEKFDQGLRRKSMQALVTEKTAFWDKLWVRQLAVASALVFCAVPSYLGIQSYYAESSSEETAFQMALIQEEVGPTVAGHNEMADFTRQLAEKKREIENRQFVVDAYAIDPTDRRFATDNFIEKNSNKESLNRVYVNDRVQLVKDASVLPTNYSR
jgi:hypothetical protein